MLSQVSIFRKCYPELPAFVEHPQRRTQIGTPKCIHSARMMSTWLVRRETRPFHWWQFPLIHSWLPTDLTRRKIAGPYIWHVHILVIRILSDNGEVTKQLYTNHKQRVDAPMQCYPLALQIPWWQGVFLAAVRDWSMRDHFVWCKKCQPTKSTKSIHQVLRPVVVVVSIFVLFSGKRWGTIEDQAFCLGAKSLGFGVGRTKDAQNAKISGTFKLL